MKILKNGNFRAVLLAAFREKQKEDPSFSMRRFANLIQVSPAKLSMILSGKTGISPQSAESISENLGFSDEDKDYFVTLVSSLHHRSMNGKKAATERLKEKWGHLGFDEIPIEDFAELSHWSHFAVMLLIDVSDFKADYSWIANRLSLPEEQVTKVCNDLFALGFLVENENGGWARDSKKMQISMRGRSEAMQRMHSQMISKAKESIGTDLSSRHLSTSFLILSEEQMEQARQRIKEFTEALVNEFADSNPRNDRVFAMGIQLFNLDQPFK